MSVMIVKRKKCIKAVAILYKKDDGTNYYKYSVPKYSTYEELEHTINHHIALFETLARKIKKNGETETNVKASCLAPAKYATLRACLRAYPIIMNSRYRDAYLMLHIRAVKAMQIIMTINPVSKHGSVPRELGEGWENRLKDLETELYDDE